MPRSPSSSPDTLELLWRFRSAPQVCGVALGYPSSDGIHRPGASVLVFVDRKRAAASLSPVHLLPQRIEGNAGRWWPVDVIACSAGSGAGEAPGDRRYAARMRPLQPGYSFGLRSRVGTLGLVVWPQTGPPEPLLLASSHCLNRRPDGRPYQLYQPSGRDRDKNDTPVAMTLRYTRLHPRRANLTEASLARPLPEVAVQPRHPLGPIRGVVTDIRLGMQLRKVSRSTGYGEGVVVASDWSGYVRFGSRRYLFARQFLVANERGPISLAGDSGALWLTPAGDAVGLNFAGGRHGHVSVCTPLDAILRRLQVQLARSEEGAG